MCRNNRDKKGNKIFVTTKHPVFGVIRYCVINEFKRFYLTDVCRAINENPKGILITRNVSRAFIRLETDEDLDNAKVTIYTIASFSLDKDCSNPLAKPLYKWLSAEACCPNENQFKYPNEDDVRKKHMDSFKKSKEDYNNYIRSTFGNIMNIFHSYEANIERLERENILLRMQIEANTNPNGYCSELMSKMKDKEQNKELSTNELNHVYFRHSDEHISIFLMKLGIIQGEGRNLHIPFQIFFERGYCREPKLEFENYTPKWTLLGQFFIYEQLKSIGILPLLEREHDK